MEELRIEEAAPPGANRIALGVLVLSARESHSIRAAIRSTWANLTGAVDAMAASIVFVVGLRFSSEQHGASSLVDSVASELAGDVLRVPVAEGHESLTLKVLHGIAWMLRSFPLVTHVLKTDDDSYLCIGAVSGSCAMTTSGTAPDPFTRAALACTTA